MHPFAALALAIGLACGATGAAAADGKSSTRSQAVRSCERALAGKGLKGYEYQHLDFVAPRSGGYSLTGQLIRGRERQEFNCVLDAKFAVQDLVVNRLSDSR